MKTLGYLITCQDRSLFMRNKEDCSWAYLDDSYTVTELVAKPQAKSDDTIERVEFLEELYVLEEQQISTLKAKLEDAVELIEVIYEFSSKDTNNLLEAKGLLHLVAEACGKWLAPKD